MAAAEEFIAEFQRLLLTKPRYNLKQVQTENCGYADTSIKSKNCYYSFGTFYCEDVYYARYSRRCTDCAGVTFCFNCEGCIECTDCTNCYYSGHCRDCRDCVECDFCSDCYSCQNCCGCIGLHQRQYCLFNEQLSAEEYRAWIGAIRLNDPRQRQTIETKISSLARTVPLLGIHNFRTENCVGDHLAECTNCYQCYDAFKLEDCLYAVEANGNRDCCDVTVCFEAELCSSCVQAPLNYNCDFLVHTDGCSDSQFCAYSKNLKNCFGCVYLADKQFYILNQPVAESEYQNRVEFLCRKLRARGRYGLALFFVSDYEEHRRLTETDSVLEANVPFLEENEMESDQRVCTCERSECRKQFRIIPQEIRFYERKSLPLPDLCPACRHAQRMALRNERQLYRRLCDRCGKTMLSTYPETTPYTIYCQDCFWQKIG